MSDLLEWVEKCAIGNLTGHKENADYLQKQGVVTFTILLASATGGLAYAVKGIQTNEFWLFVGSGLFSAYLYGLSALLVFKVLKIGIFPSLYNEPEYLNQPRFKFDELRQVEVGNMQTRIDQAKQRNATTAMWLNRIRVAAVCSPIIFVIGALVAVWISPFGLAGAVEYAASALQYVPDQAAV